MLYTIKITHKAKQFCNENNNELSRELKLISSMCFMRNKKWRHGTFDDISMFKYLEELKSKQFIKIKS